MIRMKRVVAVLPLPEHKVFKQLVRESGLAQSRYVRNLIIDKAKHLLDNVENK